MSHRLVVVGADAAGTSAASAARRECGPDELEIVAFERGNYTCYSACASHTASATMSLTLTR